MQHNVLRSFAIDGERGFLISFCLFRYLVISRTATSLSFLPLPWKVVKLVDINSLRELAMRSVFLISPPMAVLI
jgi:hypothetical protein